MTALYVLPQTVPGLEPVARLAANWAWTFDTDHQAFTAQLKQRIEAFGHSCPDMTSPATWLHALTLAEQQRLLADKAFVDTAQKLVQRLLLDAPQSTWQALGAKGTPLIAYFSAEYGIHEALANYAGGLGILAGDHLKSAHNSGVPLIGIGLWYARGYHEQRIADDGGPRESYLASDPYALGAKLRTLPDGGRLTVQLHLGSRDVHLQIWQLEIGRTRLLLLDSDVAENSADDRRITQALYGGDHHVRILQELALGVGGVFALEACELQPTVYHLNEGHAAFLSLARLHIAQRNLRLSLEEAAELVTATNVFTTHTPIAAGNDVFSHEMLVPYLTPVCASLGLPLQWVTQKGQERPGGHDGRFSMTAFALNFSARRNGVSQEHGHVSRRLWSALWPGHTEPEIGIGAVTNGVHMSTWTAPSMARHHSGTLDHAAFWTDKRVLRSRLCDTVNTQTRARFSPDALTLGFARRFAEYKRALLLFSDPDRLHALVDDAERPVQLVFAGKAHPNADREKQNIRRLHELIRTHKLGAHVAFLENYNIRIARLLVQGVDVWLNTPRPPLEASGTSGMKVLQNGALNVSVRDGWWKEAYAPGLGWAVGGEYDSTFDDSARDLQDAQSLYRSLESSVVPLFYARDNGVPKAWIDRCVTAGRSLAPRFSAQRMIDDYSRDYYLPSHDEGLLLTAQQAAEARRRAAERLTVSERMAQVRVEWTEAPPKAPLLGERFKVAALVHCAGLPAESLRVELVAGRPSGDRGISLVDLVEPRVLPMTLGPAEQADALLARGEVECPRAGPLVLLVRVLPRWSSRLLATHAMLA